MGNQMFQYAFGQRMATELGVDLRMDLSQLLDRSRGKDFVYRNYDLTIFEVDHQFSISPTLLKTIYKVKSSTLSRNMKKWAATGKHFVKEPHFHVSEKILKNPIDNALYDGWWQSESYFESVAEEVRKRFKFRTPVLEKSQSLLAKISNANAICLNVRRTDFVNNSNLNSTNKNYFHDAADHLAERVASPHFFVFSDDVKWCAENLKLPFPTTFVEHDHKGEKFGNYMQLMRACKHFIIPNSSFAWWAVWLADYDKKLVVAPKNWFNDAQYDTSDLIPKTWIRL